MRRFERWIKPIAALVGTLATLATVLILYANYKHTVTHDDELLKSVPPPPRVLPNISTKATDQAAQKQPEQQPQKEPDRPVEQPQQKAADSPPPDTMPKEPKQEPKPFTLWGYFQAGAQLRPGILFQVNSCSVGKTLVTCSMEAVSPQYDRTFNFSGDTKIIDHEGDPFNVQFHAFAPLQLDRNAPVPFRLDFPVNKDVVEPITVRINGYDLNAGNIQKAAFVIGPKDQQK